ncbi:MAG: SusC/RagA family TonB-linked outer membrane protein [Polaribacter sp.]
MLAQSKTISGTIKDSNGIPLGSTSIVVKGTSVGSSSDFDGKYSIKISKDEILVFSAVGFITQEISSKGKKTMNVTLLENVEALNEIVVTALGIKKERKALGYSVQEVKSDELTRTSNGNISSVLQGKVAGVNITTTGGVGGNARIDLRGASSLSGNDRLLWVVDGVPFSDNDRTDPSDLFGGTSNGGTLLDINPDNIESMSILKGGAAAALYGSRGANGVVLITTKSGRKSKGLGISYTGSITFSKAAYFLNLQNKYGQGVDGVYDVRSTDSWGPRFDDVNKIAWTGEKLPYQASPNLLEDFTRAGISIRNALTFSNASDKGNYFVSIAKDKTEGIFKNNEINKLNFDVKAAYDINPWLNIDTKVSYVNTRGQQRPEVGNYSYVSLFNTMPANIRSQDLSPGFVILDDEPNEPKEYLYGSSSVLTENPSADRRNPYFVQNQIVNNDNRNRAFGYFAANISFTKDLKLRLKYGLDYYRYKKRNGYRYRDKADNQRPNYNISQTSFTEKNLEFLIRYNKEINEDFTVGLSLGGNKMNRQRELLIAKSGRLNASKNFFLNAGKQITASEDFDEKEIQSLYALGEVSYKKRLYLTATARNDWSSALPINNNSYFYPSVSLSGIISEMTEMPEWISFLKVRGSWAQVGKDARVEQTNPVFTFAQGNFNLTTSEVPENEVDENVRPEISTTKEIGFEARLFKSRLNLDFTYYNEQTKNQIIPLEIDQVSGFVKKITNVGLVSNKGVEIMAKIKAIKTNDFNLGVTLNFAKNIGKLERLVTPEDDNEFYTFFSNNTIPEEVRATEGEKLGDIYGFAFERDTNGNIIVGNDGIPVRSTDKKVLGNIQADFTGSIGVNADYKGFFVNALFGMQQGGDIYSLTEAKATGSGNAEKTLSLGRKPFAVKGAVLKDGSPSSKIITPEQYWKGVSSITEEFMYDASYMKLSELAIGYNFPKSILSKIGNGIIYNARFSVIGRNLFYLYTNTPGTVPDSGVYNTSFGAQAFDFSPVPVTRSIGFSLNLKF